MPAHVPSKSIPRNKYNDWTVLDRSSAKVRDKVKCQCKCGKIMHVNFASLKKGISRCCRSCSMRALKTTHGMTGTPEFAAWQEMKKRCHGSSDRNDSQHYKERGIVVCERWLHSFENFYEDMGPKPSPKHTIERVDNDGNYEPENCRWATQYEQARNTRANVRITIDNKTMILADWLLFYGTTESKYRRRLRRGWSKARAVSEP